MWLDEVWWWMTVELVIDQGDHVCLYWPFLNINNGNISSTNSLGTTCTYLEKLSHQCWWFCCVLRPVLVATSYFWSRRVEGCLCCSYWGSTSPRYANCQMLCRISKILGSLLSSKSSTSTKVWKFDGWVNLSCFSLSPGKSTHVSRENGDMTHLIPTSLQPIPILPIGPKTKTLSPVR